MYYPNCSRVFKLHIQFVQVSSSQVAKGVFAPNETFDGRTSLEGRLCGFPFIVSCLLLVALADFPQFTIQIADMITNYSSHTVDCSSRAAKEVIVPNTSTD